MEDSVYSLGRDLVWIAAGLKTSFNSDKLVETFVSSASGTHDDEAATRS